MKKNGWKKLITEATEAVGTYNSGFDITINSLAELLELKDDCRKEYNAAMKAGLDDTAAGIRRELRGYYRDAKPFLSELGLTSSGLKKINEDSMKPAKKSALAEVLNGIQEF